MSRISVLALIVGGSLALGTTAEAHPRLTASTPANGAVVGNVSTIRLQFSERLVPAFTGAVLLMTQMPGMSGHRPMKLPVRSALAKNGRSLVLTSPKPLKAGTYRLNWHAVSADTHRITGGISFRVK